MCGIVGVADPDGIGVKDLVAIERAMDALRHRGPDDSGIAKFPFAAIGHLRLSIIDLVGGHQPMATEDCKLWVVFNGEIYNFQSIREELITKGYKFRTNSDTEVLLYAYRAYGPDCLNHFNGMFAFAIIDTENREVFLARDRLGIKPLYYSLEGERLIFSSELKAFKALRANRLELNHEALDCYLAIRYVIAPRTLLKGVNKLPPGHFAIWRNGKLKETQYWDIPTDRKGPTDPIEAGETLRSLLHDAVRLRMIADVPLGVMLSGGLDSTIITALMYEEVGAGIQTFSIATSGGGTWDERPFARLVAERYETEHHELEIDPKTYISSLEQFAWDIDDLVADPASLLLYYVSGLARRHVTVALSGEGSDELFAGYDYHMLWKPWNRQNIFNRLPRMFVPVMRALSFYSSRLSGYVRRYRLSSAEFASEFCGVAGGKGMPAKKRIKLMLPAFATYYGESLQNLTWPIYCRSHADNIIEHRLYADSKIWLPDDLLTKADRMSMAHSLELRVPFLDHRFVEFSASLPLAFKLRHDGGQRYTTKVLLRDVFAPDIPREVLTRSKQGFSLNWEEILTMEGKNLAREVLLSSDLDDIFNRDALSKLIDDAQPQDSYTCQALLSLIMFGFWYRHFF